MYNLQVSFSRNLLLVWSNKEKSPVFSPPRDSSFSNFWKRAGERPPSTPIHKGDPPSPASYAPPRQDIKLITLNISKLLLLIILSHFVKYLLRFLLIMSHRLNCPILPLLTSKLIRHYRNNSELKLLPQNKARLGPLGYFSRTMVPMVWLWAMISPTTSPDSDSSY